MNRREKKELKRLQSTRQLMGISELTERGVKTPHGELVFYLIRPDNLSVLPIEGIHGRVRALAELLKGVDSVRFMALDSRESFVKNKNYYKSRLEAENNPYLRELILRDMEHLDKIQTTTASAREFAIVFKLERQGGESLDEQMTRLEKSIRDRGFHVRLAGGQDIKRLLAVYYQQDVTTEYFEDIDGETAVMKNG